MRKRESPRRCRAWAAVAAVAVGCSLSAVAPDGLGQVLARILRSGRMPPAVRVHSECQTPAGYRRATLYGSGVAIWNGDRQVALSRGAMTKVLERVRTRAFAAMPASFGGRDDPGAARAIRVTCLVEVEAEGARKEVVQLEGGRQSAELKALAEDVFHAVDLSQATAIRADGLDDAIQKLEAGTLAPETLEVGMQRRRDPRGVANGWILRMVGRRLEVERDPAGPEAAERRRLSDGEYARLLEALAAAQPQNWPPNLYDAGYIDLRVRVLNHERSVQARAFAGMRPETHDAQQRAFAALVDVLTALAEHAATARVR